VTDISECTVVVRYSKDAPEGWPWAVSHEDGKQVLTITDLDDSSLGILLRALAQAGSTENSEPGSELAHR
jgi:hypothetical protein